MQTTVRIPGPAREGAGGEGGRRLSGKCLLKLKTLSSSEKLP